MLTALLEQKVFTTIQFTREELRRIRSKGVPFHCPYCASPMSLRIGNRNIPHFAHMSRPECIVENQNESPKHLLSKQLLYDRLNSLYRDVRLEHYLKELNQIADIYVKTDSRKIAVEIQCSNIPIPELEQRTHGYLRDGITPFWVLTQSLKRKKLLKLSSFQQAFIRYSPQLHYFLLHFLPELNSFHLYTHLYPVSISNFISTAPVIIPVSQFTLPLTISELPFHHLKPLIRIIRSARYFWLTIFYIDI
ncbi:competence protein CoiA [Rossellomorea sp. YZS02]|uniref:competence protein CoiA n=1 Tax=Rossellomorea sp. YZS02 TaxID=3097358 RepID=UPI002A0E6101|nr:competence protein CoiA family protein [Rossellomorea sp. YZS02]MDX8346297.1 competence protein CoiA family protein [Rossellomorea sp. YZS02]